MVILLTNIITAYPSWNEVLGFFQTGNTAVGSGLKSPCSSLVRMVFA